MDDKKALEKENFLFKEGEGFFKKVYSENNQFSSEYPFYEWDKENQISRYYKKIALDITDEEYEKLKREKSANNKEKHSFTEENEMHQESKENCINPIANTLKIIAIIIFFLGFFGGLIFGNQEVESLYSSRTEFSFAVAFIYWVASFISGMMFLGFAEIIQLLQDIKNKK